MSSPIERTLSLDRHSETSKSEAASEPRLVVAFNYDAPLEPVSSHSLTGIETVRVGRGKKRHFERQQSELALAFPDRWMSTEHARLERRGGTWIVQDSNSTNGVRINGVVVKRHVLANDDLVELGHTLLIFRDVDISARPELDFDGQSSPFSEVPTLCPPLLRALENVAKVSQSDISILIQGESGTGKEIMARAIAGRSARSGPFVEVNCGGIPQSLIESELFGATRGAYSGSHVDRQGLVEAARDGSLFLDEIGDLPLGSQAALLRVLEERVVRPIGSTKSRAVDFRLLCATHQDLDQMIASGDFRSDLLARISGFRLQLPALRDRRVDLGLLISRLLRDIVPERAERVSFSGEATLALFQHDFPLNVRELRNYLAAAVILAEDGVIRREHLPAELGQQVTPSRSSKGTAPPVSAPALDAEQLRQRDELIAMLRAERGNVTRVAQSSGKARSQVQRWMRRYGLRAEDFKAKT